jgi:hypothetical protein
VIPCGKQFDRLLVRHDRQELGHQRPDPRIGGGGRAPRLSIEIIPPVSKWGPILTSDDPTAPLIAGHRSRAANNPGLPFQTTGLNRGHYLSLITGEVDFWKTKQNLISGAIIDPYLNREFQYSTPAYAHAAATLVAYAGRAGSAGVRSQSARLVGTERSLRAVRQAVMRTSSHR